MTTPTTRSGGTTFALAVLAAFGAYFCMYGVRKPFSVASYSGVDGLWGLDYKPLIITAQIFGYTVSKFIGIKVVSEMPPGRRALALVALVALAELALLGFALVPAPWNVAMLFLNGLPLGMVFGLVMGFLEGRRQSEAMLAGLCCSFIVADGVVKSAGAGLLAAGVPEFWMPAATGLVFFVPLIFFVYLLSRVPPPDALDTAARSQRETMDGAARWSFFHKYAAGLVLVGSAYLLITILRSLRSDFAPEIWKSLGVQAAPSIFAYSEMAVGLGVAGVFALLVWVRNNRLAFVASMLISMAGFALGVAALLAVRAGAISPFVFMVAIGMALYLPYVAVHVSVFERLLALTRDKGNIGFLMYLVDSFGYLGYVGVMLGKSAFKSTGSVPEIFTATAWLVMVVGTLTMLAALIYFLAHPAVRHPRPAPTTALPDGVPA